jgi:hypothetical protein
VTERDHEPMSQHTFGVSTVEPHHRAWASFLDGFFAYGVFDGDTLVRGDGLDRDTHAITSIDQLVIESQRLSRVPLNFGDGPR